MDKDITKQRINRIAAGMAVSNYGHLGHSISIDRLLNWKPNDRWGNTPRSEVNDVAGSIMETDEHEDMFADEAEYWAKQIAKVGIDAFAEQYHRHKEWILKIKEIGE